MLGFGAIGQQPIGGPQWTLLQLASGAYSLTGSSALLTQVLTPTPGVYTINGAAAKLLEAHLLKGAAGAYVLTGASANPVINQTNIFVNSSESLNTGGAITLNFTAAAPAGSLVVAFIYTPPIDPTGPTGTSPVTAFSDSGNNTWNLAGSQSLGSNKGTLYAYWSYLTTALTTSDTFTVTATPFNGYIRFQAIINCYQVGNAPLTGVVQDFFSNATALFLTTATPSSSYDLMVGCAAFLAVQTSGTPTFALNTSDGWGGVESVGNPGFSGHPEFSCIIGSGWLQDTTTATKTFQPTARGTGLSYNTPGLVVLGLKLYNNVLNSAVGNYAISGAAAALFEAHVLGASPGSYAYTGFAVAPD